MEIYVHEGGITLLAHVTAPKKTLVLMASSHKGA